MTLLSEQERAQIAERFEQMEKPVRLIFFTQQLAECQYCQPTEQLLMELTTISDKIRLEKFNIITDSSAAKMYSVDKVPATIIVGEDDNGETTDYGIRFFGIPSGYEFASLLESIVMVSSGDSGLSQSTMDALSKLTKPVHIQVFVTPTCPYCPQAVVMAHRLAFQSSNITADMIEASEFPELSNRYGVHAVPKVVINEQSAFEGALPEDAYVASIMSAVGKDG